MPPFLFVLITVTLPGCAISAEFREGIPGTQYLIDAKFRVRVDPEGNVWVVDAPGQVITKMNAAGHTLMTLGTRDKRGKSATQFYLPTDIAFAPNGEFYIGLLSGVVEKYVRQ
jgi:hypothetical protein